MPRPRKRVILFIVEGASDLAALERPVQKLLRRFDEGIEAAFLIAEDDVTSYEKNNPDNILYKINRYYFEPFFSANEYYYPKDIEEVVQICDLDGTFIPDENCKPYTEDLGEKEGFIYDPPYIYSKDPTKIVTRNRRKAENIRFLLQQDSIKVISKSKPYSLFFFSSNIDHFLHGKLNLQRREKIEYAERFADDCEFEGCFERMMFENPNAIKNSTIQESWDYIMQDNNSIYPHTNLNLYLSKFMCNY